MSDNRASSVIVDIRDRESTDFMPRRACGAADLELPILGVGCWAYGGGDYWGQQSQHSVDQMVRFAIEQGCNFFDALPQ